MAELDGDPRCNFCRHLASSHRYEASPDLSVPCVACPGGRCPACCDLHGRNCETPSELCCENCTEVRHGFWADDRGVQRFGHPAGEPCSAPIASMP